MAIYYDLNRLPEFRNAVITVGTFDGVHQGHRVILNEVIRNARRAGGESVLITFNPHPRKLLFPYQPLGILTPLQAKLKLVQEAGIDHIVVVPFTPEFARMTVKDYIEKFLVSIFKPHSIVIGYDHRFGHDRLGDINTLRHYATRYDYNLVEIPAQLIDEAAVSSTRIRKTLKEGRVEEAAALLGHSYAVTGKVVAGRQLGRTIGYPTANIELTDKDQIMPALGIYTVRVQIDGVMYGGMLSNGYNPTVTDKKEVKTEVNIFDFAADIYGREIDILFLKKLRDEQKFNSLDELKERLHRDKQESLAILAQ
jgi:riboflavin kinase/FMN adenylyltransferase